MTELGPGMTGSARLFMPKASLGMAPQPGGCFTARRQEPLPDGQKVTCLRQERVPAAAKKRSSAPESWLAYVLVRRPCRRGHLSRTTFSRSPLERGVRQRRTGCVIYRISLENLRRLAICRPKFNQKRGKKTTSLCWKRTHFPNSSKPLIYEVLMT
jgi:hypothetical protein